jgi:alcohol dehydrogenase YqhD (iron-dependent ADH family)
MDTFEYFNPVRVHFGNGVRHRIGEFLQGRYSRALLVCGKGPFRSSGLFGELKGDLEKGGLEVFEMGDIDSNPRLASVSEGAAICQSRKIQCVIALGGGSTMDCSKVIAGAALTETDPRRYLWGDKLQFEAALDTVMVPTIAATGTELNNTAVILDEAALSKGWCYAECLFPRLTLIDPEIQAGVPLRLTLWGAMDILSHTFEFYFNGNDSALFQLEFSEAIIRSAMACVELLCKEPRDLRARGELSWTSIMAWGGLTKVGRGAPDMACHTIAEGVVPYYDLHHGATLGVVTPRWMRHVVERAPDSFARFARSIFGISMQKPVEAAREGVAAYLRWLRRIGALDTLQDLAGTEITPERLREVAARLVRENGPVGRLVTLVEADILRILQDCCVPLR